MNQSETFTQWLRRRRKELGLTQAELAQRVGCARITIQKIELGERHPSSQIVQRIADQLELPPADRAVFLHKARVERGMPRSDITTQCDGLDSAHSATIDTHRHHNVPAQPTALIGRDYEIAAIQARIRDPSVHLLTLTGPAGVGKTHLALELAATLLDAFADGVWFVALAPINDPALVVSAIAQAIGVNETGSQPLLVRLHAFLRDKHLLLVLDNFEHVLDAVHQVADLLTIAARLKILITSRARLRVRAEQSLLVLPLRLPNLEHLPSLASLLDYAVIRLFNERARAAQPDFRITPTNAPVIAEICTRLDGLPLAIELAAARSTSLPLQAILARLDRRLQLLTNGARDLPERQQTLRAAIEWSYSLLDAAQQQMFARLAVFAGGFTLEAATAVCSAPGDRPIDVVDGLHGLVDQSLLRLIEDSSAEPRYIMLETIREYALEQLRSGGELDCIQCRHATHYLVLAELVAVQCHGSAQQAALARLKREHDNMRAALAWSLEAGEEDVGLRLAGALGEFWIKCGHLSEGRKWLAATLARGNKATAARAKALNQAGWLALAQSDHTAAIALFEQGLAISRGLGGKHNIAMALAGLGSEAVDQYGGYRRAEILLKESLMLFRELGDAWGQQTVLRSLAKSISLRGDNASTGQLLEESLALAQAIGDVQSIAWALEALGNLARSQHDYLRAHAVCAQSRALFESIGDTWGLSWICFAQGHLARSQNDDARAAAYYDECLTLAEALGNQHLVACVYQNQAYVALHRGKHSYAELLLLKSLRLCRDPELKDQIAWVLAGLGGVMVAQGCAERAAQLLGAATASFDMIGHVIDPTEQGEHDRYIAIARAQLDEATFTAAWAAGREMTLDEARAYVLAQVENPYDVSLEK